jgi:hypothetical protein
MDKETISVKLAYCKSTSTNLIAETIRSKTGMLIQPPPNFVHMGTHNKSINLFRVIYDKLLFL